MTLFQTRERVFEQPYARGELGNAEVEVFGCSEDEAACGAFRLREVGR